MDSADSGSRIAIPSSITIVELKQLLEDNCVDYSKFTKPVDDLHVEVQSQDCFLYLIDGQLVRVVQPVFIKVLYKGKILVNTKDVYLSRNNQERPRNSLLSEKMCPGEKPIEASKRALKEELLLSKDEIEQSVVHLPEEDRIQTNTMSSKSYDGLTCVYEKHLAVLEVVEAAPMMQRVGLPHFSDFDTVEKSKNKEVQHFWTWIEDGVARASITGADFDKIF